MKFINEHEYQVIKEAANRKGMTVEQYILSHMERDAMTVLRREGPHLKAVKTSMKHPSLKVD